MVFLGSIESLSHWLALHRDIAYVALFLGSYFETLILTCFFIPGEPVFLAGAILAARHMLWLPLVLLACYGGAILGDSSSFFLGRFVSPAIFKEERKFLNKQQFERTQEILLRYGPKGVFFARFLGPASWVAPFIAGSAGLPYSTFLLYNIPGIILGVGAFVAAGYFFGTHTPLIFWTSQRYLILAFGIAVLVFLAQWYIRRARRKD